MGMSTDAILAYGWDLGEEDPDAFPWYDPDADDSEGFAEDAMRRLRASAGFTETDWTTDGFFTRQRAADRLVGVEFVTHCSYDYPMYVLAAQEVRAWRGSPVGVSDLTPDPEWDVRLRKAADVLGLETKEAPGWVLCSVYG